MKKSERPKVLKCEDGVDLISNMADDVLVLILSRLPSTEEVNRTSILSRRWRYLWTSVPSLDINCFRHGGKFKRNSFKEFVNWVLLNKSADLDSFVLGCSNYYGMSTVGRWIHAAVMRNVKQLDLRFCHKDESKDIDMSHCLVTCSSLEVLRLSLDEGRLNFPSFSGFSAVRVLELNDVDLMDGDSVKCFLESCPLLEDLTLACCVKYKPDILCISCPKLKKLKFQDTDYGGLCLSGCLKISCPNLAFLELTGHVVSEICIERLDLLKEAVLGPFYGNKFSVLGCGISRVESLRIDLYLLYQRIDEAHDPALPNLKTLELNTTTTFFSDHQFIRILKYFPKLESLNLIIVNDSYPEAFLGPGDLKSAEAEKEGIFIPDVKWLESFEYNGENPNLAINSSGNECDYILAKWGKEAMFKLFDKP